MKLAFSGPMWSWRGPSPFHFVTVPEDASEAVQQVADAVSYGWGMVPVTAVVGDTTWTTSLFPKDGRYVLPIKDVVRKGEQIEVGDIVAAQLTVDV